MKRLLLMGVMFAWASMSGCWWDDCGGGVSGGFRVCTNWQIYAKCPPGSPPGRPCIGPNPMPSEFPAPGVNISGSQICDFSQCGPNYSPASGGSVFSFPTPGAEPVYTNRFGTYWVTDGRVNAQWTGNILQWNSPLYTSSAPCLNPTATATFNV